MKTIDFKEMGVRELGMNDLVNTDGGTILKPTSGVWDAFVTYVKYSMATGGQYVVHHAQ